MKKYLELIKPKHYIKNILILAPAFCSGTILNKNVIEQNALGFFAFCCLVSCVYIINDIKDAKMDSMHPVKCKRPIASGRISKLKALIFCLFMFALFISISIYIKSIKSFIIAIIYFIVNILYTFYLKRIVIVDVFILASGFVLRVFYGASLTGIKMSNWLYLTVLTFSLFIALAKRYTELKFVGNKTRGVLMDYDCQFLRDNMTVMMSLTIIFYSLWAITPSILNVYGQYLIYTIPLVIFIVMRYLYDIDRYKIEDPVKLLNSDKTLVIVALLFIIAMIIMLYVC